MQGLWMLKDQSVGRQFVTDTVVLVAAVAPAIVYGCTHWVCHARTLRVRCKDFITIRSLRSLTIFRS